MQELDAQGGRLIIDVALSLAQLSLYVRQTFLLSNMPEGNRCGRLFCLLNIYSIAIREDHLLNSDVHSSTSTRRQI